MFKVNYTIQSLEGKSSERRDDIWKVQNLNINSMTVNIPYNIILLKLLKGNTSAGASSLLFRIFL